MLGGSGSNLVRIPDTGGLGLNRDDAFGLTPFPLLGAMPRIDDSAKSEYHPEVPCETQDPPNLEGGVSPFPADVTQQPVPLASLDDLSGPGPERLRRTATSLADLGGIAGMSARERRDEVARLQRAVNMLGLGEIDVAAAVEAAR